MMSMAMKGQWKRHRDLVVVDRQWSLVLAMLLLLLLGTDHEDVETGPFSQKTSLWKHVQRAVDVGVFQIEAESIIIVLMTKLH